MIRFLKKSTLTLSSSRYRFSSPFITRSRSYKTSAFYVQAHQDDWQYFRGEVAYQDVTNPQNKIIFIYTTAGDEGLKWGNVWWQAREQASLNSVKILLPDQNIVDDCPSFNGHGIKRSICGNTISYFLRLPDGGNGEGYPATGYQSLKRLYERKITQITAVDNSTSYSSWNDFADTMASIISCENIPIVPPPSDNFGGPWINTSDYDITVNPLDHSDHHMTSMAISALPTQSFAFYVTYDTENRKPNLPNDQLKNKENIYMNGYLAELLSQLRPQITPNELDRVQHQCQGEWACWGSKSYWRLVKNSCPQNP